jgi:hypothetical protein
MISAGASRSVFPPADPASTPRSRSELPPRPPTAIREVAHRSTVRCRAFERYKPREALLPARRDVRARCRPRSRTRRCASAYLRAPRPPARAICRTSSRDRPAAARRRYRGYRSRAQSPRYLYGSFNGAARFRARISSVMTQVFPDFYGFNGAARFRARIWKGATTGAGDRRGFNGAARFRARILYGLPSLRCLKTLLQWGRAISRADIAVIETPVPP